VKSLTAYLGAMAKFHTYSFGNIMLIARQKPDATNVAGLRDMELAWAASLSGEKKGSSFSPRWSEDEARRIQQRNEPRDDATTEGQRTLYGFRAVYGFDVSQTEGKELPTLTEVNGDVSGCANALFKFVEAQSVELSFSERIAPRRVFRMAGRSRCFLECSQPRSFPRSRMRLPTKCSTVATDAR